MDGWTGGRVDGVADSSEKMQVHKADDVPSYGLKFIFHRKSPFVPAADACLRIVNKTYITTLSLVINIYKTYICDINNQLKQKPMKIENEKVLEIIKIIVTAIISIASTLLVTNCTATMSISKYNNSSPQQIEQTTTSSVDSTTINLK